MTVSFRFFLFNSHQIATGDNKGKQMREAWDVIQDAGKVEQPEELQALLKMLGVSSDIDLIFCEAHELESLVNCLKPVPKRRLRATFGLK